MNINPILSKQIKDLSESFNEINIVMRDDFLTLDIFQDKKQIFYHDSFTKLKEFPFEELLIELKQEDINEGVLNCLKSRLNENVDNYTKQKLKYQAFEYTDLYCNVYKDSFDKQISIYKRDIEEIEDVKNLMPDDLKKIEIRYFQKQITDKEAESLEHLRSLQWYFVNYYHKIAELSLNYLTLIQYYYPDNYLEKKEDIFKRNYLNELYEICIVNDVFKEEDISFQNFYLILNQRKPLVSCKQKISKGKIVTFYFVLKYLSEMKKNAKEKNTWLLHVANNLGLEIEIIKKKWNTNTKNTHIFSSFFGIETKEK